MADQVTGLLSPYLRDVRMAAALPYVSGRVLDYGCGIGRLAERVSFTTYTGVDVDAESLEVARRTHPAGVFLQLPALPDGPFDTVTMLAVIEYVEDRIRTLSDLGSRLAPDGRMVITTPAPAVNRIRRSLAPLGLVSKDIDERPQSLPSGSVLRREAEQAGLAVTTSRRFLFGLNQLMVLKRREARRA